MNPGRELDALVAEKVMGLEPWPEQDPRWQCKAFKAKIIPYGQEAKPCLPPEYSTDIAAAWEVMEKFKDRGLEVGWDKYREKWFCTNLAEDFRYAFDLDETEFKSTFNDNSIAVLADTAPLVICVAALKAVGAL